MNRGLNAILPEYKNSSLSIRGVDNMKAVILAGGYGTRISEETHDKPKPMIEIGDRPILWHIMKTYSSHGINDFVICLGYKGYAIKEYFQNYFLHTADVTIDVRNNSLEVHNVQSEPWRVTLVDTGINTMIGGRIKRILPYIGNDTEFCLTYGDGVSNVDITAAIKFHREQGRLVTVTAVRPPGRFGSLMLDSNRVIGFQEKPQGDGGWINGGYFVVSPSVSSYIEGDHTIWEREPLQALAQDNLLSAYLHDGFWQPMDTLRDKLYLEEMWRSGNAPWAIW
jgi:glucose-1-phosphate cytidylyltransferase